MIADSTANPAGPDTAIARPYGLFGLPVSLVLILVATSLLCVVAAALVFGLAGLGLGWQAALDRFIGLRLAIGSDQTFVQRLGIIVSLVVYAALSASVLAAARLRAGGRWRDLVAWHPWHPFRGARLFWSLVVVTVLYSFGANALISRLYPPSNDWVTLPTGRLWASLFVVLAVLFAPVAEELLFRGWLYTALREKIGIWAGILVTSVLFALAHWEKTHLYAAAVFPVGIALGFVRQKTGSLRASITFHAIYNAVGSVLLVYGS